jgi:hypothetical protein
MGLDIEAWLGDVISGLTPQPQGLASTGGLGKTGDSASLVEVDLKPTK